MAILNFAAQQEDLLTVTKLEILYIRQNGFLWGLYSLVSYFTNFYTGNNGQFPRKERRCPIFAYSISQIWNEQNLAELNWTKLLLPFQFSSLFSIWYKSSTFILSSVTHFCIRFPCPQLVFVIATYTLVVVTVHHCHCCCCCCCCRSVLSTWRIYTLNDVKDIAQGFLDYCCFYTYYYDHIYFVSPD